jgi:hypothetical protein
MLFCQLGKLSDGASRLNYISARPVLIVREKDSVKKEQCGKTIWITL